MTEDKMVEMLVEKYKKERVAEEIKEGVLRQLEDIERLKREKK